MSAIEWETLASEAIKDRRSEIRIQLVFPIEVSGFDRGGKYFIERTMTSNVSENGCRFHIKTEVLNGVMLALKVVSRDSPAIVSGHPLLFQVVRVTRDAEGWTLGVIKFQPENIWCLAFPPSKKLLPPATPNPRSTSS